MTLSLCPSGKSSLEHYGIIWDFSAFHPQNDIQSVIETVYSVQGTRAGTLPDGINGGLLLKSTVPMFGWSISCAWIILA